MADDGYIKFTMEWTAAPPLAFQCSNIDAARSELRARNLIGVMPDGIGFGNISERSQSGFVISGTQTGALAKLSAEHYCEVTAWSLENNFLQCHGPIKASSESLSHAALYEASEKISSVIHIHSAHLWNQYFQKIDTTPENAAYGTPEIALALKELAVRSASGEGVIVMGGHRDGLMIFSVNSRRSLSLIDSLAADV